MCRRTAVETLEQAKQNEDCLSRPCFVRCDCYVYSPVSMFESLDQTSVYISLPQLKRNRHHLLGDAEAAKQGDSNQRLDQCCPPATKGVVQTWLLMPIRLYVIRLCYENSNYELQGSIYSSRNHSCNSPVSNFGFILTRLVA